MTTLTLQLDDELAAKIRTTAEQQRTTVDALFAVAATAVAKGNAEAEIALACKELFEGRERSRIEGRGSFTREEMNYRPSKRDAERKEEDIFLCKGNFFLEAVLESGCYYTGGPYTHEQLNDR